MPIDPARAIGSVLTDVPIAWSSSDVLLYHLAIGAGADPVDPVELRFATEYDLQVLPTFADVAALLRMTEPPVFDFPGVDIDLANVLHGAETLEVHRPVPVAAEALVATRVVDVWDKGRAAVLVTENAVRTVDGEPLWTMTNNTFIRNEGGFGGERGPSYAQVARSGPPDLVVDIPTLPQQALLYRLLGDRNPLHSDPQSASASGFPRPILHGRASFGMVCKALVAGLLGGDASRVSSIGARFSGVVFPGETLRVEAFVDADVIRADVRIPARGDVVVLADVELRYTSTIAG